MSDFDEYCIRCANHYVVNDKDSCDYWKMVIDTDANWDEQGDGCEGFYEAYGDEWKKEMMKLPKATIIKLFANYALRQEEKQNENAMKYYRITVKHDDGFAVFRTSGSSEQVAKHKIMQAEHCPESSIVRITQILKL